LRRANSDKPFALGSIRDKTTNDRDRHGKDNHDGFGDENQVRRRPKDVDSGSGASDRSHSSGDSDFITGTVITVDGGWTSALVRATED
jgi:hypothetical protein